MSALELTPGSLHVTAEQGKTWDLTLTVTDESAVIVNLTGYDCTWAMAESFGGSPVVSAGTADYLTMGGTAGTIRLVVPASISGDVDARQYFHEFTLIEPGGTEPPFVQGVWNVTGEL